MYCPMAIYGISTRHIKTINRYCMFKGVKARFCDTCVHVNTVFTKKNRFFFKFENSFRHFKEKNYQLIQF